MFSNLDVVINFVLAFVMTYLLLGTVLCHVAPIVWLVCFLVGMWGLVIYSFFNRKTQ